jgi:hypothetical protein
MKGWVNSLQLMYIRLDNIRNMLFFFAFFFFLFYFILFVLGAATNMVPLPGFESNGFVRALERLG